MIAAEYPIIEEAATHLSKISEDEYICLQMQAREDQLIRQRELMDRLDEAMTNLDEATTKLDETTAKLDKATVRADRVVSKHITSIIKKLRKNKSPEQIAEELEENDLERLTTICDIITGIGLDLSDDEIVSEVIKMAVY